MKKEPQEIYLPVDFTNGLIYSNDHDAISIVKAKRIVFTEEEFAEFVGKSAKCNMKTAEEILKAYENKTDHWADQDYSKDRVILAMEEYANQFSHQDKWVSLNNKVFNLANELAVAGFGEQAVKMHEIHNALPSSPKTK